MRIKIVARYKQWFFNRRIWELAGVYILAALIQSGTNGLVRGIVVVIGTSVVFPLLSLFLDKLIDKGVQ